MKTLILTASLFLGMLATTRATLFIQGSTGQSGGTDSGSIQNPTILDGNPAAVTANTMDLTSAGLGASLSSLTVTLYITGGQNNGLFGWLVAPNGTAVTLMNQPGVGVDGFGATGNGLQISLVSSGAANGSIQSVTGSSFLGDNTFPTYNSATDFLSFTGANPNGAWTLYFSDTIAGGGDATLNGWSLDITAVPEPTSVALVVFATLLGATRLLRNPGKIFFESFRKLFSKCAQKLNSKAIFAGGGPFWRS